MNGPPRGRFLDLFVEEAETRLRRLSEHVLMLESGTSAETVGAILRDAHSLKGAVGIFGAFAATDAALRLEAMAHAGDLTGAPEAYTALEKEISRLKPALADLVTSSK